jgi:predicted nucleotidyltransferase component of viral defense system
MHHETLAEHTERLWGRLVTSGILAEFYLAGGTALALHYGHRISVDLDFFIPTDFKTTRYREILGQLGDFRVVAESEGTLDGVLDAVKISLLRYPYPLTFPVVMYQGIALADPRDIACMKLSAISSRGAKKDFIDFFVLLEHYRLAELLEIFDQKYQPLVYSRLHLLKSLTYFVDADQDPDPKMLKNISWEQVKSTIEAQVREFLATTEVSL